VNAGKCFIFINRTKDNSADISKERKNYRSASFLEVTIMVLNRKMVELCTVKTILLRSQTEMRKEILKARGKAIIFIMW
jgi:hypothetical protein